MDLSVVIPVYGCPEALPELHRRLTEVLRSLSASYEIILVNDGCPRNSWQQIEALCAQDPHVVGVELSRNFGQIKALTAGLDQSRGDRVVVMDCDLQDRPEEIPNLLHKAEEGYDVVFACRRARHDPPLKVLLSRIFYKVYSLAAEVPYDPALCNFSVSRRRVIDSYCSMRETHRAFVMYIQWLGFRTATLEVEHNDRFAGRSGYDLKKRLRLAAEILTSQSDKLLKLMVWTGFFIAGLSLLAVFINVVRYFVMHIQPGYSSLISAIFLMGGLEIAATGVAGIYIGNIFMEVKKRPLYVVRTILNRDGGSGE